MSYVYDPLDDGVVPTIEVWEDSDTRISEVLGPDGEKLIIRRARMKIGFDLRPGSGRSRSDLAC